MLWQKFRSCVLVSVVLGIYVNICWQSKYFLTAVGCALLGQAVRAGHKSFVAYRGWRKKSVCLMTLFRKPSQRPLFSVYRITADTYLERAPVGGGVVRWYRLPYCSRTFKL